MAEEKKDMLVEVIKYMRANPDPNPPKPEAIGLKRINAKPVMPDPKHMKVRIAEPTIGVRG
jgi:hypothetical protein